MIRYMLNVCLKYHHVKLDVIREFLRTAGNSGPWSGFRLKM